ncbi:uncharacterized protein LOC131427102 [Malaya genurostris]|uniref:uncharacterized protein LOC131427102 n=1 Tax=Malaya genurostris TaxID=325434 RepID=UPI0026F3DC0C|nr:uncharacterized protein LOC131427102 [Malaya genurostris]
MKAFFQLLLIGIVSVAECWSLATVPANTVLTEENFQEMSNSNSSALLSRKKRFIVFPLGSSFSVAVCMTVGVYGNPNYNMYSWAVNWGVAYNLPNQTISFHQDMMEPKPMAQRRHRRDLYQKLETAMNSMGYNGRGCILRALCESSQYFGKKGSNMAAEILRTLFSFPKSKVLSMEHSDTRLYDEAHRKGKSRSVCHSLYPTCGFSLLELALGKYASPLSFM